MSLQNGLILLGVLIVLAVITGFAGMRLFYGSIYKFEPATGGPESYTLDGVREVTFASEDGAEITAWIKPPVDDAPVILYFMGNFTSIGPSVGRLKPFLGKGFGVAALVYRGSSGKGGTPSEDAFAADARALYDQLDKLMDMDIPENRRIVHGYSLGTGVAVRLAAERSVAALTLEAAYARFCDYFTDKYHGLPFCRLMSRERYDSINRIEAINAPLLMLHGEQDTAIRMHSARKLFEAAAEPKSFRTYMDGNHVNLAEQGLIEDSLAFYKTHVPGTPVTD
ncbi:hypothetical protein [Sneathiella sp.]|uniref:alpha/beta hydrolase n=1 Tax=Sneathiella sp. TaxID=1964365 RepID=UPI0026380F7C|nr:hypothetical protein [Sneathiella sp.]MDF2368248.1 hypothetical protein [Sneathiella sp.]